MTCLLCFEACYFAQAVDGCRRSRGHCNGTGEECTAQQPDTQAAGAPQADRWVEHAGNKQRKAEAPGRTSAPFCSTMWGICYFLTAGTGGEEVLVLPIHSGRRQECRRGRERGQSDWFPEGFPEGVEVGDWECEGAVGALELFPFRQVCPDNRVDSRTSLRILSQAVERAEGLVPQGRLWQHQEQKRGTSRSGKVQKDHIFHCE